YTGIARGAHDFSFRRTPTSLWDTAAADALLQAAGGRMLGPDGNPLAYDPAHLINPPFVAVGDPRRDWSQLLAAISAPLLCVLLMLIALMVPEHATAGSTDTDGQPSAGRLVVSHDALVPGQIVTIGLHVRLAAEWHSYWENPGDSAAAPIIALER